MNSQNEIHAKINCTISRVTLSRQAHFFILVQMKSNQSDKSVKFRTETSSYTNRPNFVKNLFTFRIGQEAYTFKFGLMMAKSQLDADATSAMVFGVCSIPITLVRLKELPEHKFQSVMVFSDRGKQVGRFDIQITTQNFQKKTNSGKIQNYDPLVSRILYNEQCTDTQKLESNIKALEQRLGVIHTEMQKSKKEQQFFQKIYYDVEEDEKQLKSEIDSMEKINSKIEHRLDSKENLQNLKIEIDMLSQSNEGKKVLVEKLEYFQDRIYREIEQNEKLAIEYKKIRPELEKNLEKAEKHAEKLKGKQLQEFQISKNNDILKNYDEIAYRFKCNEQTIKCLAKMSKKSELTAQQAKFLLSQVSYEIKLSEYETGANNRNEKILRQIEREMQKQEQSQEKLTEEEEMVYKIKLSALQREIEEVRHKIRSSRN